MPTLDEIFEDQPNYQPTDVPSLEDIFGTKEQVASENDAGFFEKETGRMGGSIGGSIAGARYGAPLGVPGVIGGAIGGAALGGGVGDYLQQEYQKFTDSSLAPKTFKEQAGRALVAGGEEALWEMAGQGLFKIGSKIWNYVRPSKIEGIDEVSKSIEKHGGQLTASQMTNNKLVDTVEGLVESTWGGTLMTEARNINKQAVRNYSDDYVTHFSSVAGKELTDEGVGTLFLNSLEVGSKIHSKIGGDYYANLDTLYKKTFEDVFIYKDVPTGILDASGKMLGKKSSQVVEQEVLPVSTKKLKELARKLLKQASPIKGKSLPTWGEKELKDILDFDDTISFKLAQEYRSKLLAEGRTAGKGANSQLGEGGSDTLVTSLSKIADDMIQDGALKTNNPEFIAAWREANSFWKEGKEIFNNKFIAKLGKTNGSAIGKKLFASDIEDIRLAKKALRKAADLSKGTADEFSFTSVYSDMQQGFMQKIIGEAMTPVTGKHAEAISLETLGKWFKKDTPDSNKFMAAFNPAQREGLKSFYSSVKAMQKLPVGAGSFMVTVGQAGLVLNTLQGTIPALQFGGDIATYTIGPIVLAKLLTHPKWSKVIAGVVRMNGRPKLGTAATSTILKLIAASQEIELLGER